MSDNPYFEAHAEDYAEQIMATQPQFYKNAGQLLNKHLPSGGRVLDVGNGGVINYEHERLAQLDCVDLVISESAVRKYAPYRNIHFMRGDILRLAEIPSGVYDAVIIQAVIHHLAGETLPKTRERVNAAMEECLRVLKPSGVVLVMESTVTAWFEAVERLFYPLMQAFFAVCCFGHVYQFSPGSLGRLLGSLSGASVLSSEKVEIGPFIWLMGKRIPTRLTPCGVTFYVLKKEGLDDAGIQKAGAL